MEEWTIQRRFPVSFRHRRRSRQLILPLILLFILSLFVSGSLGVCVWQGGGGFRLACGFRQSGLFRIRSLGGLKGWAGAGFTVGDESGFRDSLSNVEKTKLGKGGHINVGHHRPKEFYEPTPAQQASRAQAIAQSGGGQFPASAIADSSAAGSSNNIFTVRKPRVPVQIPTQKVPYSGSSSLEKRSSLWNSLKWPTKILPSWLGGSGGNSNINSNSNSQRGAPLPSQLSMTNMHPYQDLPPNYQHIQHRYSDEIYSGLKIKRPSSLLNAPGNNNVLPSFKPIPDNNIIKSSISNSNNNNNKVVKKEKIRYRLKIPMKKLKGDTADSSSSIDVDIDEDLDDDEVDQEKLAKIAKHIIKMKTKGEIKAKEKPYGLTLLENSENYGKKFVIEDSSASNTDIEETREKPPKIESYYDPNIFPDIYFTTTTTEKDKFKRILSLKNDNNTPTTPKVKSRKIKVIRKKNGKKFKIIKTYSTSGEKDKKKIQETPATSSSTTTTTTKTTEKMSPPPPPPPTLAAVSPSTIFLAPSTIMSNINPIGSTMKSIISRVHSTSQEMNGHYFQSQKQKQQNYQHQQSHYSTTTTPTTTTKKPFRKWPVNYDPRFPPDHEINQGKLEEIEESLQEMKTSTRAPTTTDSFYKRNGLPFVNNNNPGTNPKNINVNINSHGHQNQHNVEPEPSASASDSSFVRLDSQESLMGINRTKSYNSQFYSHFNKSAIVKMAGPNLANYYSQMTSSSTPMPYYERRHSEEEMRMNDNVLRRKHLDTQSYWNSDPLQTVPFVTNSNFNSRKGVLPSQSQSFASRQDFPEDDGMPPSISLASANANAGDGMSNANAFAVNSGDGGGGGQSVATANANAASSGGGGSGGFPFNPSQGFPDDFFQRPYVENTAFASAGVANTNEGNQAVFAAASAASNGNPANTGISSIANANANQFSGSLSAGGNSISGTLGVVNTAGSSASASGDTANAGAVSENDIPISPDGGEPILIDDEDDWKSVEIFQVEKVKPEEALKSAGVWQFDIDSSSSGELHKNKVKELTGDSYLTFVEPQGVSGFFSELDYIATPEKLRHPADAPVEMMLPPPVQPLSPPIADFHFEKEMPPPSRFVEEMFNPAFERPNYPTKRPPPRGNKRPFKRPPLFSIFKGRGRPRPQFGNPNFPQSPGGPPNFPQSASSASASASSSSSDGGEGGGFGGGGRPFNNNFPQSASSASAASSSNGGGGGGFPQSSSSFAAANANSGGGGGGFPQSSSSFAAANANSGGGGGGFPQSSNSFAVANTNSGGGGGGGNSFAVANTNSGGGGGGGNSFASASSSSSSGDSSGDSGSPPQYDDGPFMMQDYPESPGGPPLQQNPDFPQSADNEELPPGPAPGPFSGDEGPLEQLPESPSAPDFPMSIDPSQDYPEPPSMSFSSASASASSSSDSGGPSLDYDPSGPGQDIPESAAAIPESVIADSDTMASGHNAKRPGGYYNYVKPPYPNKHHYQQQQHNHHQNQRQQHHHHHQQQQQFQQHQRQPLPTKRPAFGFLKSFLPKMPSFGFGVKQQPQNQQQNQQIPLGGGPQNFNRHPSPPPQHQNAHGHGRPMQRPATRLYPKYPHPQHPGAAIKEDQMAHRKHMEVIKMFKEVQDAISKGKDEKSEKEKILKAIETLSGVRQETINSVVEEKYKDGRSRTTSTKTPLTMQELTAKLAPLLKMAEDSNKNKQQQQQSPAYFPHSTTLRPRLLKTTSFGRFDQDVSSANQISFSTDQIASILSSSSSSSSDGGSKLKLVIRTTPRTTTTTTTTEAPRDALDPLSFLEFTKTKDNDSKYKQFGKSAITPFEPRPAPPPAPAYISHYDKSIINAPSPSPPQIDIFNFMPSSPSSPSPSLSPSASSPLQNYTFDQIATIKKLIALNQIEKNLKRMDEIRSSKYSHKMLKVDNTPYPTRSYNYSSSSSGGSGTLKSFIQPGLLLENNKNNFASNSNEKTILALKALALKKAQSINPTPKLNLPQQVKPDENGGDTSYDFNAGIPVDLSAILEATNSENNKSSRRLLRNVRNAPKSFYPGDSPLPFEAPIDVYSDFTCENQSFFPGLYADTQNNCKMFHLCAKTSKGSIMKTFRCPIDTAFDQEVLKCNWSLYVDCPSSKDKFYFNKYLSQSFQFLKILGDFSKGYKPNNVTPTSTTIH